MDANLVYALSMALCGVMVSLIPLVSSYQLLCVLSGLFGLFIAANYSLTSIILVELITLERFTNAYGLLLLVQGVANLIGPPLAGTHLAKRLYTITYNIIIFCWVSNKFFHFYYCFNLVNLFVISIYCYIHTCIRSVLNIL